MANRGIETASARGWAKSRERWTRLIGAALEKRGITAHAVYIERVLKKTFNNNAIEGGNIGWETIDSYVGYLQATDELGTPIKSHGVKFHRDKLNWAPRVGAMPKKFRPERVWGGDRPSSAAGTSIIRSRW